MPSLLSDDSNWSVDSISETKAMMGTLERISVIGTGFTSSATSNDLIQTRSLCIFDTEMGSNKVSLATFVDSSTITCLVPTPYISSFTLYISMAPGTKCISDPSLTTLTVHDVPEIHSLTSSSTLYSNSSLAHTLVLNGFRLNTLNHFDYELSCNGYESVALVPTDDITVQIELGASGKVSLSTSKSKCYVLNKSGSSPSLPILAAFDIVNLHLFQSCPGCLHEIDRVTMGYILTWVGGDLKKRSTLFDDHSKVSFCELVFYRNSSDTGTTVNIENDD